MTRNESTFERFDAGGRGAIASGFELAARFKHKGLRGSSREEVVADFLSDQLPGRFGVTSGEAVDLSGSRSGQLDIVFYDR